MCFDNDPWVYILGVFFVNQKLADGLEQHVASQRKRELPNEKKHSEESCNTVSTRVREIAKSTLHFSDLDVDQFFFDSHKEQQVIESYHTTCIPCCLSVHCINNR